MFGVRLLGVCLFGGCLDCPYSVKQILCIKRLRIRMQTCGLCLLLGLLFLFCCSIQKCFLGLIFGVLCGCVVVSVLVCEVFVLHIHICFDVINCLYV